MYFGLEKNQSHGRNLEPLERFIAPLTVVDFDIDMARIAARIRAELHRQGKPIGPYDIQIAACALCRGFILLTNS